MGYVMSTPNQDPLWYVPEWRKRFIEGGWWHSFELPDGSTIRGVSALDAQKMRLAQFPIPHDLSGKRVLDIGAWDGWFSFEMERRGAEVLAIDRFDNPRFHEIRERLGSRVEYRRLDVYEVSPCTVGRFDIVLFLGVLYHLKHPLLALERVCSVARDMAAVESFVLGERHGLTAAQEERNLLQFFEDDDFGGQVDNWFAPTTACLLAKYEIRRTKMGPRFTGLFKPVSHFRTGRSTPPGRGGSRGAPGASPAGAGRPPAAR